MFLRIFSINRNSQGKGFIRNEKGAVILLWALALIPLLAVIGVAIDVGRAYYVHAVVAGAVDAAAIAGAKAAGVNGDVQGKATAIFNANLPPNFQASIAGPNISLSKDNKLISVTARGEIPTVVMGFFGKPSISAGASAQSLVSNPGTEIVLALDNTGSMAGSSMASEIKGAQTLINIVYGGANIDTVDGLYVAIVPYTTTVNLGKNATSWLSAAGQNQVKNTNLFPNIAPTAKSVGGQWMGCVEARTSPLDSTDATPSGGGSFTPFFYPSTMAHKYVYGQAIDRGTTTTSTNALAIGGKNPNPSWGIDGSTRGDNDWKLNGTVPSGSNLRFGDNYNLQGGDTNAAVGPNLGCPVPILPLTASQKTVQNTISSMKATFRGGTMINVGLAAAWWTISPNWKGLWPGVDGTLPKPYKETKKFLILMTDGQNQWFDWDGGVPGKPAASKENYSKDADYTGYGRLAEGRSGSSTTDLNTKMLAMCDALKKQDVTVYTILYGSSGGASAEPFRTCASDSSKYFLAPTESDLIKAFTKIGQEISYLRLTWPGKP